NQLLRAANTPVSRVVESILKCMYDPALTPEKSEAEVERVGNREIRHLESYLKGLEMTANIGPLMGLLGTVSGMIHAFAQLEAGGAQVDPAILAGGLWEALLTTVAGLAVAIPALAAFYAIDSTVERIRAAMKDASIRVLALEDYMHYEEQKGNVHPYPAPQQQETHYAQQQHPQQYAHEASGGPFYARAGFGG
ncbi:MAG: MotA/TolQ/ExbB proton channel family protein, partial [Alphaproteobacteria bacterium]|nr:MotA/TolQ/ExbB proton channel family protein [Alphaproteobacteria bacterium]